MICLFAVSLQCSKSKMFGDRKFLRMDQGKSDVKVMLMAWFESTERGQLALRKKRFALPFWAFLPQFSYQLRSKASPTIFRTWHNVENRRQDWELKYPP